MTSGVSLSSDQIARLTAFARALADAAKAETVARFRSGAAADNKAGPGDFDPVTEADRAAERAMRALIAETFPSHGIEGEEGEPVQGSEPYLWTLDPIDGTRAYIAGLPLWTTLIALSFEGTPIIGIIDQPVLGERYLGAPGAAALETAAGSAALKVRPCARLTDAVISTTDPFIFAPAEYAAFEQVRRAARLARYGCDAYAYAQVAAGHIDIVIEAGLQTHDVRALRPVVEGAGGVFTDWRGRPGPDKGQVVAAGDPRARDEALVALKRSAAP